MDKRDKSSVRFCKCCGTKLSYCNFCKKWYAKKRLDQLVHGGACRKKKQREKSMVRIIDGGKERKAHVVGELRDGKF